MTSDAAGTLTPEYRDMLIRLMTRQLYAETATAEVFGKSIALAPTWPEKYRQAEFAYEEAQHSQALIGILRDLDVDSDAILADRPPAAFFWNLGEDGDLREWLEIVVFNFIVDRAGSHQIMQYRQSSYEPWAKKMGQVLADEEEHYGSGIESLTALTADPATRDRAQAIVNRLLPVTVKRAFGRPDAGDNEYCLKVGLKRDSAHQIQAGYLREMRDHLARCGLRFPSLARFDADGVQLGPEAWEIIASLQ
ncbi:MAG TPA: Phenylacetic acid catabolic protein [Dehalococcoidia bacterium]|nr:Phenylacetic acid catabolic protein [Dehalococcoidia bacterium]